MVRAISKLQTKQGQYDGDEELYLRTILLINYMMQKNFYEE